MKEPETVKPLGSPKHSMLIDGTPPLLEKSNFPLPRNLEEDTAFSPRDPLPLNLFWPGPITWILSQHSVNKDSGYTVLEKRPGISSNPLLDSLKVVQNDGAQ